MDKPEQSITQSTTGAECGKNRPTQNTSRKPMLPPQAALRALALIRLIQSTVERAVRWLLCSTVFHF